MDEDKQSPEKPLADGASAGEDTPLRDETRALLSAGPGAGSRSGALAFLALLLILAAVAHYCLSDRSGGGYVNRLDSELINHAELSLAAARDETPMAVVPAWPVRMYETLRRDIVLYAAFAAAAAYAWSSAARARARRDAFLVHRKLAAEVADLRLRLEKAEAAVAVSASASGLSSSESQRKMKG